MDYILLNIGDGTMINIVYLIIKIVIVACLKWFCVSCFFVDVDIYSSYIHSIE